MSGRSVRSRGLSDPNRAIYIDFEGNENEKPTLLGVLWPRSMEKAEFEQFVFEETFFGAADARGCHRAHLQDVIARIVSVAESEDLEIVAWSGHELEVVEEWAPAVADRFKARYRNAIKVAKRWRRLVHPDVTPPANPWGGKNTLDSYMRLVDYKVSTSHGRLQTGDRLTYLRRELSRKEFNFARLTATSKSKWTKLLKHNYHDCFGMRQVDETAARELGDRSSMAVSMRAYVKGAA